MSGTKEKKQDDILSQESESESELLYDWRLTAKQFVLSTSPLKPHDQNFYFATKHLRL
jgi:hypothetical protein